MKWSQGALQDSAGIRPEGVNQTSPTKKRDLPEEGGSRFTDCLFPSSHAEQRGLRRRVSTNNPAVPIKMAPDGSGTGVTEGSIAM